MGAGVVIGRHQLRVRHLVKVAQMRLRSGARVGAQLRDPNPPLGGWGRAVAHRAPGRRGGGATVKVAHPGTSDRLRGAWRAAGAGQAAIRGQGVVKSSRGRPSITALPLIRRFYLGINGNRERHRLGKGWQEGRTARAGLSTRAPRSQDPPRALWRAVGLCWRGRAGPSAMRLARCFFPILRNTFLEARP